MVAHCALSDEICDSLWCLANNLDKLSNSFVDKDQQILIGPKWIDLDHSEVINYAVQFTLKNIQLLVDLHVKTRSELSRKTIQADFNRFIQSHQAAQQQQQHQQAPPPKIIKPEPIHAAPATAFPIVFRPPVVVPFAKPPEQAKQPPATVSTDTSSTSAEQQAATTAAAEILSSMSASSVTSSMHQINNHERPQMVADEYVNVDDTSTDSNEAMDRADDEVSATSTVTDVQQLVANALSNAAHVLSPHHAASQQHMGSATGTPSSQQQQFSGRGFKFNTKELLQMAKPEEVTPRHDGGLDTEYLTPELLDNMSEQVNMTVQDPSGRLRVVKRFRCTAPGCTESYVSKTKLRFHHRRDHNKNISLKCFVCGFTDGLIGAENLIRHVREHIKAMPILPKDQNRVYCPCGDNLHKEHVRRHIVRKHYLEANRSGDSDVIGEFNMMSNFLTKDFLSSYNAGSVGGGAAAGGSIDEMDNMMSQDDGAEVVREDMDTSVDLNGGGFDDDDSGDGLVIRDEDDCEPVNGVSAVGQCEEGESSESPSAMLEEDETASVTSSASPPFQPKLEPTATQPLSEAFAEQFYQNGDNYMHPQEAAAEEEQPSVIADVTSSQVAAVE